MAQTLDSEPLLTPIKIEFWNRTKLNTCPVPRVDIYLGWTKAMKIKAESFHISFVSHLMSRKTMCSAQSTAKAVSLKYNCSS